MFIPISECLAGFLGPIHQEFSSYIRRLPPKRAPFSRTSWTIKKKCPRLSWHSLWKSAIPKGKCHSSGIFRDYVKLLGSNILLTKREQHHPQTNNIDAFKEDPERRTSSRHAELEEGSNITRWWFHHRCFNVCLYLGKISISTTMFNWVVIAN